jgi:hypothetical protein
VGQFEFKQHQIMRGLTRGKVGKGLLGAALLAAGALMLGWHLYSGNDFFDWATWLYFLIVIGFAISGCLLLSSTFKKTNSN